VNPEEEREVQAILGRRLATAEQVAEAEEIRRQMEQMGLRARSVAEVLCERGYIDQDQLESLRQEEHTVEGKERIAGYQLLEFLGRGALGAVYRAKQLSLDRVVAIKVLDRDLAADAEYVRHFLDEARTVARISHTNLISGIDVGEEDGLPYVVMEYAAGVTVAFLLRRGGSLDEERALHVGLQVARALDHAHKNGLVHGDVKPDNVIVTRDGVAKLTDLGVARLTAKSGTGEDTAHVASPDYWSPEQGRGKADVGPAADLYGLGATLFHMLTGEVPFPAESREATLARLLTEPPPSPRARVPDLLKSTEAVVLRCLQKGPDDRYADAAGLVMALEGALREAVAARNAPAAPVSARGAASSPTAPAGASPAPTARRRRRR
jgi:serine/threonine-protein kinase